MKQQTRMTHLNRPVANADMPDQGLRILARIIARCHSEDNQPAETTRDRDDQQQGQKSVESESLTDGNTDKE